MSAHTHIDKIRVRFMCEHRLWLTFCMHSPITQAHTMYLLFKISDILRLFLSEEKARRGDEAFINTFCWSIITFNCFNMYAICRSHSNELYYEPHLLQEWSISFLSSAPLVEIRTLFDAGKWVFCMEWKSFYRIRFISQNMHLSINFFFE